MSDKLETALAFTLAMIIKGVINMVVLLGIIGVAYGLAGALLANSLSHLVIGVACFILSAELVKYA